MTISAATLHPDPAGRVRDTEDVSVGGRRHRLTFDGPVDGPVLLWLDGGLGNSELGSLQTRNGALFEQFLVVHVGRLPGANGSSPVAALADLVADASCIIDLIRQASGKSRIILVGHSIGAALGLLVAAERQDALSLYVGINQPVAPLPDALLRMRLVLAQAAAQGAASAARIATRSHPVTPDEPLEVDDLVAFAQNLKALHRLTYDPMDLFLWAAANEGRLDGALSTGLGAGAAAETWESLADFDALAHVPPLDIPTLFIAGRHDPVVPVGQIERYVDAVYVPDHVRLVVFEKAGHFAYWEEAARFNELMLGQIRGRTRHHEIASPELVGAVNTGHGGKTVYAGRSAGQALAHESHGAVGVR